MAYKPLIFLSLTLLLLVSFSTAAKGIGVNWGTTSSHPLPPPKVVELLKSNGIAKVKLIDAEPLVLESLAGSNIRVTVGIPNSMLRSLNGSLKAAENWVHQNLTRFVADGASRVLIDYVAVGDDAFLQSYGDQFHPFVIGASDNIQTALLKANLAQKVKVVVPCSFDSFQSESNLPSKAQFRTDINQTMIKLLTFLTKHNSPFFTTISPFLTYQQNKNISLDFALFREKARPKNDTRKTYKNSFDLSYDTVTTTLTNTGFPKLDIIVSSIGWPTDGAIDANSSIAQEFLQALINHFNTRPRKSNTLQDLYIFSLFDEDKRNPSSGSFERHWGVFTFDGQAKYQVDLGQGSKKLLNAQNVDYLSPKWCVVNDNKDLFNATAIALEACAAADCTSAASPGSTCYDLKWPGNISYAFNSYYQQHDQRAESCGFSGLGLITTVDPSVGDCRFFVGLRNSFSVSIHELGVIEWVVSPVVTMLLFLLNEIW